MPADRAALVDALRVCRRWIVEGQAQIGWSVDRIDEVLAAAAIAAPPEAAPASLVAGERPIVWLAMNGHGQIFAAYWDEAEAARNTQYVTGVRVSGVQPDAPALDCRAAVRAALLEVREEIAAMPDFLRGADGEPSGFAIEDILDAKLAALENATPRET